MSEDNAVKYEYTINNREVRFKERVPVAQGHVLRKFMRRTDSDDYSDDIPALQILLAPCQLVPDPADRRSFLELDTFSELVPLIQVAAEHIVAKIVMGRDAEKNSASGSS